MIPRTHQSRGRHVSEHREQGRYLPWGICCDRRCLTWLAQVLTWEGDRHVDMKSVFVPCAGGKGSEGQAAATFGSRALQRERTFEPVRSRLFHLYVSLKKTNTIASFFS